MKQLVEKYTGTSLVLRILAGLILGALLGSLCPQFSVVGILGSVFTGALKAIAPVLVFMLVSSALAKAHGGIGGRFRTVIFLYLLSTMLAAVVAVAASYLFPVSMVLSDAAQNAAPEGISQVLSNLITSMVANPVGSLVNANYVGVLFWAVVFGLALKKLAGETTINSIGELAEVVSQIVRWVIEFAPFGIMGLVFQSVSESGLSIFVDYGRLLAVLVGAMLTMVFVVDPIIVFAFLRRNPFPLLFRCLKESGLTAFFTRSSAANIPVNMALCEKLGLDRDFYSVSIPLGATINMDGAAITITIMTMATAHTLGIAVDIPSAVFLSIMATLGACGASGVAGGSLLLIPMACSLFGIGSDVAMQAVSVGFIIGVVQDSLETALNSSGDVLFAATAEFHDRIKRGEDVNI